MEFNRRKLLLGAAALLASKHAPVLAEPKAVTGVLKASEVAFQAAPQLSSFRYVLVYDETKGDVLKWFDYGSDLELESGETFSVEFDSKESVTFQMDEVHDVKTSGKLKVRLLREPPDPEKLVNGEQQ